MVALRLTGVAIIASLGHQAQGQGNELCWYNSGRTYQRCCSGDGYSLDVEEACWSGVWFTEDFCCHPLPPGYQRCFEDIEERVFAKIDSLQHWEFAAVQGSLGLHQEGLLAVVDRHIATYRHLLAQPLTLWNLACSFPASPMVWSERCACCEPKDEEECPDKEPPVAIHEAHWQCCYPVYTRKSGEPPDEKVDASIRAQLGATSIPRSTLAERGRSLQWQLTDKHTARGCVIAILGGRVLPCDEGHACPGFDCSYMRALVLTLTVIQGIRPLPDLEFVLNAGDVTLDAFDSPPTFTRTGTKWTNTVALPFEWQLHPGQCFKHLKQAMAAAEAVPWERRQPRLIWRGSNSNCRTAACNPALAADRGGSSMEACGRMDRAQLRDCTWNSSTWLRMPRGRLVWLTRFSASVDARFVLSRHLPMAPDLENFLRGEDLIANEPMGLEDQAFYKYAIAVEGDSAPDRVYWQLFSGSALLIPDGPWQVFATAGLLEPFVHYIPVRYDLGDLLEKVAWLQQHDEEARRIARRGAAFSRRHLTCDGVLYYVDRLLRQYTKRLVD